MHKDPHQASASFPQSSVPRPRTSAKKRPRVLALSSSGGHWIQMLRLRPAFEGCQVTYVTTYADYECDVEGERFRSIVDANRTQKCKLLISALSILWVILTERPDVILSTGAAPGFFAIRIGKLLGKRTIWLDSIANAEELSMSGHRVAKHADMWLTQWEHLAKAQGPHYHGNILGEASKAEDQRTGAGSWKLEAGGKSNKQRFKGEKNEKMSDEQFSDLSLQPSYLGNQTSVNKGPKAVRVFVTVGSDVPFDRMLKVIDQWAGSNPGIDVFAQIGTTLWKPQNLNYCQILNSKDFASKMDQCNFVVAHAGIGSIITALKYQKPILVVPRRGHLNETRSDHQFATVKRLQKLSTVNIAFDEFELKEKLKHLETMLTKTAQISDYAASSLIKAVNDTLTSSKDKVARKPYYYK